jgi:hypothetical protein
MKGHAFGESQCGHLTKAPPAPPSRPAPHPPPPAASSRIVLPSRIEVAPPPEPPYKPKLWRVSPVPYGLTPASAGGEVLSERAVAPPRSGLRPGRCRRRRNRHLFRLAKQEAVRNRQDESLLSLVIGQSNGAPSALQETPLRLRSRELSLETIHWSPDLSFVNFRCPGNTHYIDHCSREISSSNLRSGSFSMGAWPAIWGAETAP